MLNEQLLDYIKRFKQLRDVARSHLGSNILNKFIEQSEEYRTSEDDEAKKKMRDDAYEAWMAYLVLRGRNQSKYGTIMKGFVA